MYAGVHIRTLNSYIYAPKRERNFHGIGSFLYYQPVARMSRQWHACLCQGAADVVYKMDFRQ